MNTHAPAPDRLVLVEPFSQEKGTYFFDCDVCWRRVAVNFGHPDFKWLVEGGTCPTCGSARIKQRFNGLPAVRAARGDAAAADGVMGGQGHDDHETRERAKDLFVLAAAVVVVLAIGVFVALVCR